MFAPSINERNPLGDEGLDLSLFKELEKRVGILPEPLGMAVMELRHLEGQRALSLDDRPDSAILRGE